MKRRDFLKRSIAAAVAVPVAAKAIQPLSIEAPDETVTVDNTPQQHEEIWVSAVCGPVTSHSIEFSCTSSSVDCW